MLGAGPSSRIEARVDTHDPGGLRHRAVFAEGPQECRFCCARAFLNGFCLFHQAENSFISFLRVNLAPWPPLEGLLEAQLLRNRLRQARAGVCPQRSKSVRALPAFGADRLAGHWRETANVTSWAESVWRTNSLIFDYCVREGVEIFMRGKFRRNAAR